MWTQHHPKDHVGSATWKNKRQNKNGDKSENKAGGGEIDHKVSDESTIETLESDDVMELADWRYEDLKNSKEKEDFQKIAM